MVGDTPKNLWRRYPVAVKSVLAVILLGVLIALFVFFDASGLLQVSIELAHQHPVSGFFVVMALMLAHNFFPVPAQAIAFIAGSVLGPVIGLLAVWCGALCAAYLAFWTSRLLGRDVVFRILSERQRNALASFERPKGWLPLIIVRCMPFIPFNLVNYSAGLTPMRSVTFMWTTAIGIIPVIALATMAGAEMASSVTG